MKKGLSFFLILLIIVNCYLLNSPTVLAVHNEPQLSVNSKALLKTPNSYTTEVLASTDHLLLYTTVNFLGAGQLTLEIDGKTRLTYPVKVTAFLDDLNAFYLGALKEEQTLILMIDKSTYKITEQSIDSSLITSLIMDDETLVIAGQKDNNAYMARLNSNFEVMREQTFGGEGMEKYESMMVTDTNYIACGIKDADSMENVGNKGEQKVFLSLINKDLTTAHHEYLNFGAKAEQPVSVTYNKGLLNVLIKAGGSYYLSQFSDLLEFIYSTNLNRLFDLDIKDCYLLMGQNDDLITVFNDNFTISYAVINSDSGKEEGIYNLDIDGEIIRAQIKKGLLEIITKAGEDLTVHEVDNYQEENYPLVCSKEYCPINEIDDIGISSHFGEVKTERLLISPYFSNSISGCYQGSYQVVLPSQRVIKKTRDITVEPYVNIVDGGIYPTNYTLDFFDYGKLNGVSIARNKKITTPGDYSLTLTNNIGEVQTINFMVVDNYLKSTTDNIQRVDTSLERGENFTIELPFTTSGKIKSVEINDHEYQSFTYQDQKITVTLTAPSGNGVYPYLVKKVNVNYSGRTISEDIKQVVIVRVNKMEPLLEITSSDQKLFKLNFQDQDQTLVDLVVNIYENKQLKSSISSALKTTDFTIDNLIPHHTYTIKLLMKYHLGDGVILEKELISFDTSPRDAKVDIGKLSISKQNQTLEEATFLLNVKAKELQKLKVATAELELASYPTNYLGLLMGVVMILTAIILSVIITKRKKISSDEDLKP